MLKNQSILEIKKDERIYQFHLSPDSQLGEIHDVLHEMKAYIIQIMIARANPKEENEVKIDKLEFHQEMQTEVV